MNVAPGGLALVHLLLNTVGFDDGLDQLGDFTEAELWWSEAVAQWAGDGSRQLPAPELAEGDVPALRELRDGLTRAIAGEPVDGMAASLQLELMRGVPAIRLSGPTAAEWLRSAVLTECWVGRIEGTWSRLKVCANPECPIVFYDRSRNRSGTWHAAGCRGR